MAIDPKLEKVMKKALEKNIENRYRTRRISKALEATLQVQDISQGYWLKQDLVSAT